jgi:hypothetical protein
VTVFKVAVTVADQIVDEPVGEPGEVKAIGKQEQAGRPSKMITIM